jgi:GH15 family glucan-1,4-alpha-glucosidase
VDLVDFFPRPKSVTVVNPATTGGNKHNAYRETIRVPEELKKWLVRRVECVRGELTLDVELFPAFGYALDSHETTILQEKHDTQGARESKAVTFHSAKERLQLDVTIDCGDDEGRSKCPMIAFKKVKRPGMTGEGVVTTLTLAEGQAVSFVLRNDIERHVTANITTAVLDSQQNDTQMFWFNWLGKSKYKGRWREVVLRSLMILKLLTYEPTGAIVAAPTFSIPEDVGGVR